MDNKTEEITFFCVIIITFEAKYRMAYYRSSHLLHISVAIITFCQRYKLWIRKT